MKTLGTYVALLRGINVGGKNKLPMKDLASVFAEAGCSEVQTYIQSGNVVFRATPALANRLPAVITEAVTSRFGLRVPVVMRTSGELHKVANSNPFLCAGADEKALHVAFLANPPDSSRVNALDSHRSPPDQFSVRGQDIYLHCPNGLARSKLTNAYFDSGLATTSTLRNWRTVLKLLELAS